VQPRKFLPRRSRGRKCAARSEKKAFLECFRTA
jgi:hypothetical protein